MKRKEQAVMVATYCNHTNIRLFSDKALSAKLEHGLSFKQSTSKQKLSQCASAT